MNLKIRKVLYAMLFGNGATILVQLITVPILIKYWGVNVYGEWLILSTIPGYLILADLGAITFSLNKIHVHYRANKMALVKNYFKVTYCLIVISFSLVFLITITLLKLAVMYGVLSFENIGDTYIYIAGILVIDSMTNVIINFNSGLFRLLEKYHKTVYIQSFVRLIGALLLITFAVLDYSIVECVILVCTFKVLFLTMIFFYFSKVNVLDFMSSKLRLRINIPMILKRSTSLMLLPISNIVYLNLSIVIIAALTDPRTLVIYNSTRTMTRFATQFIGIFGKSWWSEITQTSSSLDNTRIIYRKILRNSIIASLFVVIFGLLFGEVVFNVWLDNEIEFSFNLFVFLLLGSVLAGMWTSLEVMQLARNKFREYSIIFFVLTILKMLTGFILTMYIGVIGMPIATFVVSIYIVYWVHNKNKNLMMDVT